MSVWPSETIVVPSHPAVTFTQSDRPCTHPEPPPLPTAMVRAHSHRCLCGALARERRRRRRGTNAERRTSNAATHEWRQITRARTSRPDVTTVTVTMTPTMTATVVVLRVVVRRAHRVTRRRRWRWRWRCRRLHGASSALRVTHTSRHARTCARHHRASRASSPFPFPPRTTGTRALRRRSLARSIARAVWRWRWR